MRSCEFLQNFSTVPDQFNVDLASIFNTRFAGDQILVDRSVDQADCAVMSDL
jgi:hypothetical protein